MDNLFNVLLEHIFPIIGTIGVYFIIIEIIYSIVEKKHREMLEYLIRAEVARQLENIAKEKDSE